MSEANYLKPGNKLEAAKRLKKVQQKLASLSRQYARTRVLERKQDTRAKIKWGGLIKKAGLDNEPPAVLLGLLLDAFEKLSSKQGDTLRNEWRLKGDIAFTMEERTAQKEKKSEVL